MSVVRRTLRFPRNTLYALSEALWYLAQAIERPKTRGDCAGGERPCPWSSCKHHLAGHVTAVGSYRVRNEDPLVAWRSHSIAIRHHVKDARLEEVALVAIRLEETCVLDVADRGPVSLVTAARLLRVHSKSARESESSAKSKMKRRFSDE